MSKLVSTENKKTDNRSDKIKLYSIGAVVILIGILVIVNVLFEKILGKALTIDFSASLSNTFILIHCPLIPRSRSQDFSRSLQIYPEHVISI